MWTHEYDGQGNVTEHRIAKSDPSVTVCARTIYPCRDRVGGRCEGFHDITERTDVTGCAYCGTAP